MLPRAGRLTETVRIHHRGETSSKPVALIHLRQEIAQRVTEVVRNTAR